ncbi:unnamed protein product (macronuclear) [Paramecium tetraurelia]|uniref:signal-recognition-particle GTPase n=1 Tax=Paramecium tetraurelia TaxID=5888 RepID=A0C5I7_PARTE|nr:uncharacterized protein GSPATT00006553001 [Paramecium tetraurelia]CAK66054.1 unnamed protein product [Paramecium tetraurelia]|eukprot:XP_001433451.1 hypothetical protein (macronuclear) [Paramecium tetraurelia strain d4-2]
MVLTELGQSIKGVLNKLNQPQQINEVVVDQILNEISIALQKTDVNESLIQELRENIRLEFKLHLLEFINLQRLLQKSIIEELTKLLQNDIMSFQPKKGQPNVMMLIGLKGSGKTSTCFKYAYYFQKRGWKVGIICAGSSQLQEIDWVKQQAKKIKVLFYGSYFESDPVNATQDGVQIFKKEGIDIILIDTVGKYEKETDLCKEMKQMEYMIQPDNIIFVMDSSIGQICQDQVFVFKSAFNQGSIIITKVDRHSKGGGAISAVVATNTPIDFICNGEGHEDLLEFQSSQFISKLLGFEDLKGLLNKLNSFVSIGPKEKQFTLRDLESEVKKLLKFGSINYFFSKCLMGIPSINVNEKEQTQQMKRYLYILNSMTSKELDGQVSVVVTLSNSRIIRIAKGSGTTIEQVNNLLKIYKSFIKTSHTPPKHNFKELSIIEQ